MVQFRIGRLRVTPVVGRRILLVRLGRLIVAWPSGFPPINSLTGEEISNLKAQGYQYLDLCSVIRHELGHVFGFEDDGPGARDVGEGSDCKDEYGIMAWTYSFDDDSWTSKGLSESDKCRFMKVYCCAETVLSVLAFPSDTSVDFLENDDVSVLVCSVNGVLLSEFNSKYGRKPRVLLRDRKFDSGAYLIVVSNSRSSMTFKMVASY